MRTDSYRSTYAREGAPNPMPPAPQPPMRMYPPTQGAVLNAQPAPPPQNTSVRYGASDEQGQQNNGSGDTDGTRTVMLPPREPGSGTQPGGSIDDANSNHVRDRWDDGGTHVRDSWNDRNGMRAHETWDADGTHVRDAWNEQTGQHIRDTWASDGAHLRDAWDEQGNHLREAWTPQGQYLRNAWNELTVRMQDLLKQKKDGDAGLGNTLPAPGGPAAASPGDGASQPEPDAGDRRGAPIADTQGQRPVGDGRYGRGAAGPQWNAHRGAAPSARGRGGPGGGGGGPVGPTGGDGGGGGGSSGPTGEAGQMRNTGPGGNGPNMDSGTGASQFSQAAMNRLNSAPENLMHFLDLAIERLDKYGANDPELQQWFGKNANVDEIRRTLTRMRETLASGDYKFSLDPNTKDNWEMAHVFPADGSHTIHVRPHMLDPVFGKNTPEVTIAHELSHFNDIGGTRDLKYGDWNAATLARTNSSEAMHNAENYGMFIRQVAQLA